VSQAAPLRPRLPLPQVPALTAPTGFEARLDAVGGRISSTQLETVGAYLALLLAMNEQVNLTAIVSPHEAWERHALDALTLLPALSHLPPASRVADVGSGGGVPGLVLAIARPDLAFVLVESIAKKAAFLEDAARALGLANVWVRAERAEAVSRSRERRSFDVVTARAVARLDALVRTTAPLANAGGRLAFIKGQRADEELDEAKSTLARLALAHRSTTSTPTGKVVVIDVCR
jgi:16S rRNA (guanine527-N7)-methyltransferase